MGFPSFSEIQKRVIRNSQLYLPVSVRKGILSCLSSSPSAINDAKAELSNAYGEDYWAPPEVSYESASTIDAYTIDYLPRNFFIPRIAIRDLSLCPDAVKFDKNIRVLDIGSGTGAVSLGIFELFSKAPLNDYNIHFYALDKSEPALNRQKCILDASGLLFDGDKIDYEVVVLSDANALERFLSKNEPWDIIISANCLNEIEAKVQTRLMSILSDHLTDNGSIIVAEPALDRGKIIIHNLAEFLSTSELQIYYPCSNVLLCEHYSKPRQSDYDKCWIWRDYPLATIKYTEVDNQIITFSDKPLSISLIILNKSTNRILDPFEKQNSDLNWGFIRQRGRGTRTYEICPSHNIFTSDKEYINGSIVGWEESSSQVKIIEYFEL